MESATHMVDTLEQLELEAHVFAQSLKPREKATFITLSGDLGAGKTTFTQLVAKALGVTDVVNSPTFVIEKVYQVSNGPFSRLVHIDAYRLKSGDELLALGFNELLQHPETIIILEWPERVPELAEQATISVKLEALLSGSRHITYA